MNTAANRFVRGLLIVACVSPLSACATLFGADTEGQVLEEGTNKPLPDAIVIVRWAGVVPVIGHASSVCVRAESTTTDKEGRYRTAAWRAPSTVGPAPLVQMNIGPGAYAYKPGHEYLDTRGETVYLKPFTGGREERLKYLRRISSATSCGSAGDSEKNLYPLRKAIYEEARQIAKTDFEKYVTAGFEQNANSLLLPPDKRISMPTLHREKSELLKAIEDNNVTRVKALLAGSADPNDRANDGATMLMAAIRYGRSEIAMLLLENGANPNAVTFDDQNQTAMDQLIYRNQDRAVAYAGKIAALMIEKGYNVNHRDVSGKTALEKATQYGAHSTVRNAEIIKVLKEHATRDKQ